MARKRTPKQQIQTTIDGVRYDRETGDFTIYLGGELVGFARTAQEAETTLAALKTEIAKQRGEVA